MTTEQTPNFQHEAEVPVGGATLIGKKVTAAEFCVYSPEATHEDQIPFGD